MNPVLSPEQLRAAIITAITQVAPDASPQELDDDDELRDELDIDSMDFLNIMIALYRNLGVNIPEQDYDQVTTMKGLMTYLSTKLGATGQ